MRIALLSTLDRDPRPGRIRPAFVPFAGARVIDRQLDLALSLGCEAVACMADGIGREVIQLQHRAERAGAKFMALREPAKLSGLVTATDEILVIASGVLPDAATTERLLTKPAVIAFPADIAVPAGFERIDPEFAWSGVLLTRGNLVERLVEMEPDIDVPSVLMRLALQSGTRLVPAERKLVDENDWTIDATREGLAARELRWIEAQREPVSFHAPGIAIAERAGTRLARDIVGGRGENGPVVASGVLALFSIAAGALAMPAFGLAFVTFAALFARIGRVVERVAKKGQVAAKRSPLLKFLESSLDILFILLIYLASSEESDLTRIFVPVVLMGLLRLGESHGSDVWRRTYADRILLGFLLTPATFLGFGAQAAAIIALLVLATRFFGPFRKD
ncbi:hypothetical protein K3179_12235 [Qipengyuania sp. GH38]|uniref:hypothetical protein n=1 Tax=Qipengyuania intermedia TaxID=2867244 RepID=UPI001C8733BF|nr:hypothetical protein [Qipengyuania intermedia]MBX7515312.1 hypothetical protein [Qipengyuania intermedia]